MGDRDRLKFPAFLKEIQPEPSPEAVPLFRRSSGRSLLKHAGTWVGDDIEECLQLVSNTRSEIEF